MKMLKGIQVAATLDRLTSRRGSWEAGGRSKVRNLEEMVQNKQQENVKEKRVLEKWEHVQTQTTSSI